VIFRPLKRALGGLGMRNPQSCDWGYRLTPAGAGCGRTERDGRGSCWFPSPVPKSEGPGAPSVWFLGRRDRGHPPRFCISARGMEAIFAKASEKALEAALGDDEGSILNCGRLPPSLTIAHCLYPIGSPRQRV
jgi:hypothetical protein